MQRNAKIFENPPVFAGLAPQSLVAWTDYWAEMRKKALLTRIFKLLIAAENLEEADKILPRQLQLIKEQPRPKKVSKFGGFDDEMSIKYARWIHERTMVETLAKVGKLQEAKARLERMADLPDMKPQFFTGNLASIRQGLMLKLGLFDDLKEMLEEISPNQPQHYAIVITLHLVGLGRLEEATKEFQTVLDQPQEDVFKLEKAIALGPTGQGHFATVAHEKLAEALVKSGDVEMAVRVLTQVPEHEQLTGPFSSFGRTLCADGDLTKLEPWLEKLPHPTARVHARLAAWNVASTKESAAR